MSLVGRVRGEVEKTRHLQELTRRDETKLPDAAASSSDTWHDLSPYLESGWQSVSPEGGDPTHWARYRKEGDRVHFGGTVQNVSAGPGATNFIGEMPVGYQPGPFTATELGLTDNYRQNLVVFESPDGSDADGVDAYWLVFAEKTQMYVYESHTFYTASPNFGGVPEGQALNLNTLTPYSTSLSSP